MSVGLSSLIVDKLPFLKPASGVRMPFKYYRWVGGGGGGKVVNSPIVIQQIGKLCSVASSSKAIIL